MKEAGELGEDADAKIKAQAESLNAEEIQRLKATAKKAEAGQSKAEASDARSRIELDEAMVRSAFGTFYDDARADKGAKLPVFADGGRSMFVRAGIGADGEGRRWRWTGKYDTAGTPVIVQRTADGEHTRMGPDEMDPLTVRRWAETDLRKSDALLFKSPNGSDPLNPGQPGAKALHDMTPAQVRARVDQGA